MTALKAAVVGDVGDYRIITLSGVEDLDAVTALESHVWVFGGDAAVTLTTTVEDSAARQIRVELGGADGWLSTAAPGRHLIEYQLTFGSTVLTWPNGSPDQIQVRAQGA